jgi:hypothetical protein
VQPHFCASVSHSDGPLSLSVVCVQVSQIVLCVRRCISDIRYSSKCSHLQQGDIILSAKCQQNERLVISEKLNCMLILGFTSYQDHTVS